MHTHAYKHSNTYTFVYKLEYVFTHSENLCLLMNVFKQFISIITDLFLLVSTIVFCVFITAVFLYFLMLLSGLTLD